MSNTLKILQLKAKQQVYTLLSGGNLSPLRGEGYDFFELREYQVGDDIRKINWSVTAKLGRPYIKETHSNRELSIVVAALMDGSFYFGKTNNKQKKLTEIATILGYACEEQGNLFSGFCYTQDKYLHTPPTKHLYDISQFSKSLFNLPLLHTTLDNHASIKSLFKSIHTPSLVFILGDFLEEVDLSILSQKHEVIAIIVRDAEEETPKKLGEATLTSPKNTQKLKTFFGKSLIKKYLQKLHDHDKKLIKHFSIYGIRYIKISTDEDVLKKLLTLFT